MVDQEIKEESKIRCSKCNSSFGYIRFKDKKFICRSCGHETDAEEEID